MGSCKSKDAGVKGRGGPVQEHGASSRSGSSAGGPKRRGSSEAPRDASGAFLRPPEYVLGKDGKVRFQGIDEEVVPLSEAAPSGAPMRQPRRRSRLWDGHGLAKASRQICGSIC